MGLATDSLLGVEPSANSDIGAGGAADVAIAVLDFPVIVTMEAGLASGSGFGPGEATRDLWRRDGKIPPMHLNLMLVFLVLLDLGAYFLEKRTGSCKSFVYC